MSVQIILLVARRGGGGTAGVNPWDTQHCLEGDSGEHFYKGLASKVGQQVSSPGTMISSKSESDILIVPTPWILLKTQDQN